MKIVVINAYNRQNAGDAALLSSALRQIREAFPSADISYAGLEDPAGYGEFEGARNLGSIRRWAGDESLGRGARVARKVAALLLASLPGFVLRALPQRTHRALREPLAELAAIASADLVVGLGGGYLNGARSLAGTLNVFFLCLPIELAHRLGARVVLAPQSYGPFHGRVQRALVGRCLNRSYAVVVREDISALVLSELGIPADIVQRGVDSAFDVPPLQRQTAPEAGAEGVRVGITARAWLDRERQSAYERELSAFVDWLQREQEASVVLLPQVTSAYGGDDDRIVSRRIAAGCDTQPEVIETSLDHQALRAAYADLDYLVGTRFHSVIFGLTSWTPAIAIAYEHKTTGIMADLGLSPWVLPIETVTDELLRERYLALVGGRGVYLDHLGRVLPDYQARAHEFVDILRTSTKVPG